MSEKTYFRLDGQVAAVTGAGQGIGEAIARRLADAGARVVVLDLQEQSAVAVAGEIGGLGLQCDVSSSGSVEHAFREIEQNLGPVDILVNNAGITGRTVPLWELDERDLDAVYAVNLKGVFLCAKAVVREMLERRYGRILNVASIAGKEGNPTMIPYSSTKASVIGLTKALAKEVAGKGDITVNCISPAVIRTKILEGVAPETVQYMVSRIPMGRTGTLDEVASLVQYLVSREASFTTGQCYDISGGRATY
ncbi:MAG TPA: glucose 1-dehydrogenase [Terriglobia bacterium]|jgi:3-oxoacyl-[acyl-carrier protein] reductase|nr:glucose 1-dehydrogenase [Terriglobia bacterium]